MLVFSPKREALTRDVIKTIHRTVRERLAGAYIWPPDELQGLAYFQQILSCLQAAAGRFTKRDLSKSADVAVPLISAPIFSTRGQSFYAGDLLSDDGVRFDLVVVDIRLILEVYAVFLQSPLSATNYRMSDISLILKLCVSTRLNSFTQSGMQRFSLGYVADAFSEHFSNQGGSGWVKSLATSEAQSKLDDFERLAVFRALASFTMLHEFSHALFHRSPEAAEAARKNVNANLNLFIDDLAHRRIHDAENAEFLKLKSGQEPKEPLDNEKLIDELRRFAQTEKRSVIADIDSEEFSCDTIAVQLTLDDLIADARFGPNEVALVRSAILLMTIVRGALRDRTSYYAAVEGYFANYAERRAVKRSSTEDGNLLDKYVAELAASQAAAAKHHQISGLRMRLLASEFDEAGFSFQREKLALLDSPEYVNTLMKGARSVERNYQDFEYECFNVIFPRIFSFEAVQRVSSCGRGLELFFSSLTQPRESRRDADPFALHVLGYSPAMPADEPPRG